MINPFNAIAKSKVDTDKIGILISDRLIIGRRDKSIGWVSLGWQLVKRYPDMQNHLDDGIAVSVNGEIYRDSWSHEIPEDAEVFLLPRIQGG